MRKAKDFEVSYLGIQNSSYFQGYGVSCTQYTDCVVGIGDNPREALEDALDIASQSGDFDIHDLGERILERFTYFMLRGDHPSVFVECDGNCEGMYYYIGIRWN